MATLKNVITRITMPFILAASATTVLSGIVFAHDATSVTPEAVSVDGPSGIQTVPELHRHNRSTGSSVRLASALSKEKYPNQAVVVLFGGDESAMDIVRDAAFDANEAKHNVAGIVFSKADDRFKDSEYIIFVNGFDAIFSPREGKEFSKFWLQTHIANAQDLNGNVDFSSMDRSPQ